ncbi:hypothetical protein MUJ63_02180 [Lachnospiraceae bacterium NSJ-143]|nr:hypothetical protein [Lachnospiraceae bacterium NSJ-143]
MDEENRIKVYIKTDDNGNITDVNSSIFLDNTTGWTEIDEGTGDRYAHAQGHYFDKPITTDEGVYRYKYAGGAVSEKTSEEIEAEATAILNSGPAQEQMPETM